jgi:hypothetical protein
MRTREEVEELIKEFKKQPISDPLDIYFQKYIFQLLYWFLGDKEQDIRDKIEYELGKIYSLKIMHDVMNDGDYKKMLEYCRIDHDQKL